MYAEKDLITIGGLKMRITGFRTNEDGEKLVESGIGNWYNIESIKPIPITHKGLNDLGYKIKTRKVQSIDGKVKYSTIGNLVLIFTPTPTLYRKEDKSRNFRITRIEYLHELQQFCRLINKEEL